MKPADRAALTIALQRICEAAAADVQKKILEEGPEKERARRLHRQEKVGDDYAVWTDLLSRRAAVLWALKSVYLRVLEDRDLVRPLRIADTESQQLFERLAPNLGPAAYLRWIYRDLATGPAGLSELFGRQPAEVAEPSDETATALLELWRDHDPDTGLRRFRFEEERFDGQLMGDLYQDLDPVVKARFALLQTPGFVRDFILDQALTPALETWPADQVRVLDPACGSGHFLLEAFARLVDATAAQHPDWARKKVVEHALDRVVGIDLNDYACALARTRLVMRALDLAGGGEISGAAVFHPRIYWADALEQVERVDEAPQQGELPGMETEPEKAPALMTLPEVRAALAPVLTAGFHVVVANPPYITEKDKAKKKYHRAKIGARQRYVSASGKYSLVCPFTERCFQLSLERGYVGLITSNNFTKREFGRALVEKVLAEQDLFGVVDSSGAYIPGHGTPTVLLFSRKGEPNGTTVHAVMGKRGEPSTPSDPTRGEVWLSICAGYGDVGYEDDFVSVAEVPGERLRKHPWTLSGGGAAELKVKLDAAGSPLSGFVKHLGPTVICGEDEVYVFPDRVPPSLAQYTRELVIGTNLRDWSAANLPRVAYPYESIGGQPYPRLPAALDEWFFRFRTTLRARRAFGVLHEHRGLPWFSFRDHYPDKLRAPSSIAFAFVATHNHFILDRGGRVFKQTAPVIKLPEGASDEDHLALLGLLNSSVACFWMKQVFHNKGGSGDGKGMAEDWMDRFEFDATKMASVPVPTKLHDDLLVLAHEIDSLAQDRAQNRAKKVLSGGSWANEKELREQLATTRNADFSCLGRMIALQEDLDCAAYAAFGLAPELPSRPLPSDTEMYPGQRPFEQLRGGVGDPVTQTAWFSLQGWGERGYPLSDLPEEAARVSLARAKTILANRELRLIETPRHKRRWYRPSYDAEQSDALAAWLIGHLEDAVRERGHPTTARELAAQLQSEPRVRSVAEIATGRRDYDLESLFAGILNSQCVPEHPSHVYKESGLQKRAAWEKTWSLQRLEDAGEDPGEIPVPPRFKPTDFLRPSYWRHRGKLDVPREPFIAFTEVPVADPTERLYGWAAWSPKERVAALLGLDERLEDQGVALEDRIGLLDSAWRLLPDLAHEDPTAAGRRRAEIQQLVGHAGPTEPQLEQWRERFPPPSKAKRRRRKKP